MQQVSLLMWAFIETLRNLGRGRIWGPFIGYWIAQGILLFLLTQFHQPLLAPVLVPIMSLLGGEPILHYPVFYLALPMIYSVIVLALDLLVGSWLFASAFLLFWQADHPAERFGGAVSQAAKVYGRLVLARLPLTVLLILLLAVVPAFIGRDQGIGGNALRMLRYGSLVMGSIVEALFLYTALAVLIEKRSPMAAVRRSLQLAGQMPLATVGAVLIPNLVQIPVSAVLRRTETIVLNMTPEVVAWVLFAALLLYAGVGFLVTGSATRLFRVRTEGARA